MILGRCMVFGRGLKVQRSIREVFSSNVMTKCLGLVVLLGGTVVPQMAIAYGESQNDGAAIATPQELVNELNRIRETPDAYAEWLETLRPYYDQAAFRLPGEMGIRTVEGVYALDHAIAFLSDQDPLPPINLEPGLVQSTQEHLSELVRHNRFTLAGVDGSTPITRAEQYGTLEPGGRLTEILSQGFTSAEAIVASLVIDDGSFRRSTRSLLLNPAITGVGAGCGFSNGEMPLCVFDYATTYNTASSFFANTSPSGPQSESVSLEGDSATTSSSGPFTGATVSNKSNGSLESGEVDAVASETTAIADSTSAVAANSTWSGALSESQLAVLADELITETNVLRSSPSVYAAKLVQLRSYYQGNLIRIPGQPIIEVVEGVAALDEAIAVLQNTSPMSTLTASEGLSKAAADHAKDLGSRDATGHYGSDNSDPFVRMNRYGKWDQVAGSVAGENISYGPPTLAEWHIVQLLVDDNFPSRGHRQALLNPDYRQMGAACEPHPTYRIVCDMTYASDYQEGR